MARIWMSGFELNSNTSGMEVTAAAGTPTIQNTTVRSGVFACQIESLSSGTAKGMRLNFAAAAGNGPYYFLTYFRYATAPSADNQIIQLNDTNAFTTPVVMIKLNSSGALELWDEDGQIGSDSSALAENTWYRVEILFDRTPAAGSQIVRAYLDGTEFAGLATRNLSGGILTYNWGGNLVLEAQTQGNWFFDDMAVNDSTGSAQTGLVGEEEMILLSPDGAGSAANWTRGGADSGANWSQVEEVPPTDATDYVLSNTAGTIDYYTLAATPAAMDTDDVINCISVGVRFAVDSATGGDPDFRVNLKDSAANTDNGSAIDANSTSWRTNHNGGVLINYTLVSYTRAGGAGAWTKSELDSAQVGIEETITDTHNALVSGVWVYVGHKPAGAASYTETGFSTFGKVADGADQSAWVDAGAAVWGEVGAGVDQSTWIDAISSTWGEVSSSADQMSWTDTGASVWGMVADGTETYTPSGGGASYVETGFSVWAMESAGADVLAGIDAGAAVVGQVTTGSDTGGGVDAGAGLLVWIVAGVDLWTMLDTGVTIWGMESSGDYPAVLQTVVPAHRGTIALEQAGVVSGLGRKVK